MRALDLVATAAALGVFGYFVYKVILPKLGDLELPSFQLPPPITQQPETPAPAEQLPPPQPIEQDPEKPKSKPKEEEKPKEQAPLVPSRSPPAAQAPPPSQPSVGGAVIYDSNIHGKWNSGKRVVTKGDGNTNPGGGGLHTAASGDPTLTIDGNGVAHLESSDLGRIYVYAKHYNARLEGSFMFEVHHGAADNISIKLRSRHGHSGHTTAGGANEFGGMGVAFHPDGQIEMAAEIIHKPRKAADFPSGKTTPFTIGQWYKFAISVFDGGGAINTRVEINGKTVATAKWTNPDPTALDKAAFAADSFFWVRLNSYGGRAKVALTNLRLVDLGASANVGIIRRLMIDEPYLYNGYYNRRRL